MADWSVNNRACTSTWMALRLLAQHKRVFSKTGELEMQQLAFWNSATSDEMRDIQARALAVQLNNVFRGIDGATLEPGVKEADAVSEMEAVLVDSEKTVADLASINDSNYRFFGEVA
jgi:hypothetical protein